MENSQETLYEQNKLKNDKKIGKLRIQEYHSEIAQNLINGMGQDMKDVLTNKKVIEGYKKEPFKNKIGRWLNNILRVFG